MKIVIYKDSNIYRWMKMAFIITLILLVLCVYLLVNNVAEVKRTKNSLAVIYGVTRIIFTDEVLVEIQDNPRIMLVNSKYQNYFIEGMQKKGYTYLPDERKDSIYVFSKEGQFFVGIYEYGDLFCFWYNTE